MTRLPSACLREGAIDGPGLISDGIPRTLDIPETASDGETGLVRMKVGERWVEGRFRVTAPNARPLAGRWRQTGGSCAEREPIGELTFSGDGSFSLTIRPFEIYKDFWGRYAFKGEGASGVLELTVEDGNRLPNSQRIMLGVSGLSGEAMTLSGPDIWDEPRPCEWVFKR
jgi:hypothetical protein